MAAPVSSALLGSVGYTNYARLGQAAQHELPIILRELLLVKMSPSSLHYRVSQNQILVRLLRPNEMAMIKNAPINGYSGFNIPFMYALIRNLNLVPPPTRGWDPPTDPTSTEISVGDDVERIRRKRNEILNRGNVNVSDTELADHLTLFKGIASRLENYLGKTNKEFVSLIENLEKCNMDKNEEQMYLNNLKQLRDIEKDTATIKLILEDKVPEEIKRLDRNSVRLYCKLLKEGTSKRRHFRLVVVGPKGSGKTSLVRRILQESTDGVEGTNGIDIHVLKCKISTKEEKMIFVKGLDPDQVAKERLKKCILENMPNDAGDDDRVEILYNRSESPVSTTANIASNELSTLNQTVQDPVQEDLLADLSDLENVQLEMGEYATTDIWDFAGDRQFYNTHQMFLSKDALYIVTVDMSRDFGDIIGKDGEDPTFWLQTIHYYGNPTGIKTEVNPPIMLIGTKKDMLQGNSQEGQEGYNKLTEPFMKNPSLRNHVKYIGLISNTDPNNEDTFIGLRKKIVEMAKHSRTWEEEIPIRWVHLEKKLLFESKTNKVISKSSLISFCHQNLELITDEEIELFLRFHHESGDIVYFDDIPDYVILKPQWLADAFKCIISSKDLQTFDEPWQLEDWDELTKTGLISNRLIDLSLERHSLKDYKDLILRIMEKFDILIPHVTESNSAPRYYIPSMIETAAISNVDLLFDNKQKTSCLCIEFEFLPPFFHSHILASCNRKYSVSTISGRPVFFKGIGLLDLDESGCEKLLIATIRNVIQLQVWRWGDDCCQETKQNSYNEIMNYVCTEIKKIQEERYKIDIPYRLLLKCNLSRYDYLGAMKDPNKLKVMNDYFCEEHNQTHKASSVYSDWFGLTQKNEFSTEQTNFTKMGIITLDILADVLFDLLIHDCPTYNTPRNECDITKLYSEHRNKTKLHCPSRGVWGGNWIDINKNETYISIGDDIERIRLTRNELQHSKTFALPERRFHALCILHRQVLDRFDKRIPNKNYLKRLDEVLGKQINKEKWVEYREKIQQVFDVVELEMEQHVEEGDGCTIRCRFTSTHPKGSNVQWSKEESNNSATDLIVAGSGKYEGSTLDYPSLIIKNANLDDEGFYSCRIIYPENYLEIIKPENIKWPKTYLHVKRQIKRSKLC